MDNLKRLRKQRKLTQNDMGDVLNISATAYGNYELGQRSPTPETLIKLADFFGVSVDYLIGREKKDLIERPPYEITDKQTLDIVKLCKAMNEIQKAQVFGYVVGLLEQAGVNVSAVLNDCK